jgi:membrane protein DedA with SNARE-associated domain
VPPEAGILGKQRRAHPKEYLTIQFLHQLAQLLLGLFHAHELTTLFVAILVEEAGIPIPIPGDALVTLAGAQTPHTIGQALVVVGISSVAIFLGSSLLFTVVHRGGRPLLTKYGRYVLLNEQRLARMERWFASRGRSGIIAGRLIPGLRIPTTIMAGLSGVAYAEFAITMAIAAVIWSAFYYILGGVLGRTVPLVLALIADVLDDVPRWVVMVSVLILLAYLGTAAAGLKIRQIRLRRHRRPRHLRHLRHLRQESHSLTQDR